MVSSAEGVRSDVFIFLIDKCLFVYSKFLYEDNISSKGWKYEENLTSLKGPFYHFLHWPKAMFR